MEKKITFECPKCGETLSIEARLVSNDSTKEPHAATTKCSCGYEVKATGKGGKFTKTEFRATKPEQRIEALRAAGVNVTNFMLCKGVDGTEKIMRITESGPQFINDDDAIFNAIIADDRTLYDPRLFRRWVLAQTFDALEYKSPYYGDGFNGWLRSKGYEYQFKMMLHELQLQAKIEKKDPKNYSIHRAWFDAYVVYRLCREDFDNIEKYIDGLKVRHCKGKPYKRIKGVGDVFVKDIETKVLNPLIHELNKMTGIEISTPALLLAFSKYCSHRISLPWDTKLSPEWVDAYKGIGAYYAMENLIKFHGCKYNPAIKNQHESLSIALLAIDNKTHSDSGEGYKMQGILKEFLKFNGINIAKMRAEWRKAKLNK
ncbi:MAG: hypothetical protein MJZ30_11495 [Paludibacteraceae bacterium]|nr:hypothetical protein [Paludibacteraceae bacterium]